MHMALFCIFSHANTNLTTFYHLITTVCDYELLKSCGMGLYQNWS